VVGMLEETGASVLVYRRADGDGPRKGLRPGIGGKRQIYSPASPCWETVDIVTLAIAILDQFVINYDMRSAALPPSSTICPEGPQPPGSAQQP
jgi:hypothetical protein